MSGVNKVILVGRLGKDPEERYSASGSLIVTFSLATSESWKDKNTGERQERTQWHNLVIFREALGRLIMQYLKKGSLSYCEGALQTRKWTDDKGVDRYTTEIIVSDVTFLGSRRDEGSVTPEERRAPQSSAPSSKNDNTRRPSSPERTKPPEPSSSPSKQELPEEALALDDEIPF